MRNEDVGTFFSSSVFPLTLLDNVEDEEEITQRSVHLAVGCEAAVDATISSATEIEIYMCI